MDDQSDDGALDKKKWMSAAEALERVKKMLGWRKAPLAIAKRANNGLIETRAVLFVKDKEESTNVNLPTEFWWAKGHAELEQDWDSGDFDTWIDKRYHWQAFGVTFNRGDVEKMLEGAETLEPAPVKSKQIKGRPTSDKWPLALARVVVFLYEDTGFDPKKPGTETRLIEVMRDGLKANADTTIEEKNEVLGASTLKPFARAILELLKKDIDPTS
ncbi:MAG: hypothetical protein COB49_08580 [Alphaproteobacteria bacterium]|nr:MAG: hypothetical protein COB49_08580 [Alphaproteobacteria bacterium]